MKALQTFSFLPIILSVPSIKAGKKRKIQPRRDHCPFWLAPSNLNSDDNDDRMTKYGIFAGQDYDQNATLPLVIPLVDMFGDFHRITTLHRNILSLLENMLWAPALFWGAMGGKHQHASILPRDWNIILVTFHLFHF
ncbi:hypothetical protein IV203_020868 [Nitzschia inconspicua]|uniref:Uncharacterized protein n=1 Tax=Nitzschia inconspicua TaxID=303405 RepID=A0A9K3KFU1_9STRA|nr:hypothetical protein IV203_020868 [Nitzschia inconspicua]